MTVSTPDHHDCIVVEAPTAEDALAEVTDRLGSDAVIVEADRALRGGIGGFFQREVVRLTARPQDGAGEAAPAEGTPADDTVAEPTGPVPTPGSDPTDAGVAAALARLSEDVSVQEESFGTVLRRHLAPTVDDQSSAAPTPRPAWAAERPVEPTRPAPPPTLATPALSTPAVVAAPPAPPLPGGPAWSVDRLLQLGLPASVVDPCRGLAPDDDLAWLRTVAGAVASLCRPLPAGPSLLVGPRAERLARALGLETHAPPAALPRTGDTAASVRPRDDDRAWLAHVRRDRWVHLVAGGSTRWRVLLEDEPLAVSWVHDADLPDVVRAAAELGLVLGYRLDGRAAHRAAPVDVAIALRGLVAGR